MRHYLLVVRSVAPIHKSVDLVQAQVHILDDGHLRGSRDAVGQIGKVGRLVVVRRLFIYRGEGKGKRKRNIRRKNAPPECLARDSSIIRSNIVRARTKVSFIDTKWAMEEGRRMRQRAKKEIHTSLLAVLVYKLDDLWTQSHT